MHIIPATPEHAFSVARDMRECDRQEILATTGDSPGVALLRSLEGGDFKFACTDARGEAFAVFGVGDLFPAMGSPWMLASERLYDNWRWFVRATPSVVDSMLARWPVLFNYVDARNVPSIRWLSWAGFTILPPVPYGVEGRPFHPFTKVRHV